MDRGMIINNNQAQFLENTNILYLMIRDCRIEDNHALLFAQKQAIKYKQGLIIGFMLIIDISNRQFQFLIESLKEIERKAKKHNISFMIIKNLNIFIKNYNISQVISDFSPLIPILDFKKSILISHITIDTHNIVPVWVTSNKQEYAARTIRPKIYKHLYKYAVEPEKIKYHPYSVNLKITIDWKWYKPKINNKSLSWCKGGYDHGMKQLSFFIEHIKGYAGNKNDPLQNATSNLSPWLHFGNISSLRCYLELKNNKHKTDRDSFLEEIIVRKELSDNYCYYNKDYDSVKGLPNWAFETLKEHEFDQREVIYTLKQLFESKTDDMAWNFAQQQLINNGKIHGYMRMYWGKKIIEWSNNIETAYKHAIYLNDTYSIDGNDPNGYVGVLWCFGLHDRAFQERKIYGKVRYMSKIGKELVTKL